ncbi:MAG: RNA polymerase sigma factor [Planctomycetota bacterium]|nr:RNA polymerase sigma factor [Planctomycetota bacterium]
MSSDGTLVREALAGCGEAYGTLVHRWTGRVLALCHAKTGQADAAEDLAQETLVRGYVGLGSLEDVEKFGAWLCGIARRVCLDWLKSRRRSQVAFSEVAADWDPADSLAGPEEEVSSVEQKDEVEKLLSEMEGLPGPYREALMLYYYEEHTYRELAEVLGVSPATVNARLTKGRAILRRRLSATKK